MSSYPVHLLGVIGPTPEGLPASLPMAAAMPSWLDLPESAFLKPLPRFQNQSSAGACTEHSGSFVEEQLTRAMTGATVQVSRLFGYRVSREYRGWENQDSGAYMGDVYRGWGEKGRCSEITFGPYQPRRIFETPPPVAYAEAAKHKVPWRPLNGAIEVAAALAGKHPAFDAFPRGSGDGFPVAPHFFDLTGVDGCARRVLASDQILGGHSTAYVGFHQNHPCPGFGRRSFLKMNSWLSWGIRHPDPEVVAQVGVTYGFYWVPEDLVNDTSYSSDIAAPTGPLPVEV